MEKLSNKKILLKSLINFVLVWCLIFFISYFFLQKDTSDIILNSCIMAFALTAVNLISMLYSKRKSKEQKNEEK
jgi:hypothetical protein